MQSLCATCTTAGIGFQHNNLGYGMTAVLGTWRPVFNLRMIVARMIVAHILWLRQLAADVFRLVFIWSLEICACVLNRKDCHGKDYCGCMSV